jgi:shikimate dehydrogenase
VQPASWEEIDAALGDTALLVNTTTLGMRGQPALTLELKPLPARAIVADLVYVPVLTELLAAAKNRGLQTADGLGMLLHQAVGGFTLWFGQEPEVTAELRALISADLGEDSAARNR